MTLAMEDIKTSFTIGYERLRANPGQTIMPLLVIVCVVPVLRTVGHFVPSLSTPLVPVSLVVLFAQTANLIEAMIAAHDGRPFSASDMFKIHPHLATYFRGILLILGISLVIGLIMMVVFPVVLTLMATLNSPSSPLGFAPFFMGLLILGAGLVIGAFSLVLPTLIWLSLSFPALYLIIERNTSAVDALQQSIAACRSNLLPLFGFFFTAVVINTIGAVFLLLPCLFTIPVTGVAAAHVYRQLFGGRPHSKVKMRKT